MKFRFGQKVVAVVDADGYPTTNVKGTIVDLDGDLIGVEFDEDGSGVEIEYFLEGRLEENVKIDPSEKTITFEYDSKGIKEDVLIIYLPSKIIEEPLAVFVNGEQEPNAIRSIVGNITKMTIPLYEDSKTISIKGVKVIPEFGPIVFLILGTSIFAGIIFTSKSKFKQSQV